LTLSPNSASTALRPASCANVQPASPTGPTYAKAIFKGSALGAAAADAAGAAATGASFLLQPTGAAVAATAASAANRIM
jgi:hypothetical protein